MNVVVGILIGTVTLQFLIQTIVATSPSPWPAGCNCPTMYKPVCGDNDITYSNRCALNCASDQNVKRGYPPINEAYTGECNPVACDCSHDVQPVCGTDGRTYINECQLECYNRRRQERGLPIIKIAYQGKCTSGPNCPDTLMPLCGTDGRTYGNICYLQYQSRQNELIGVEPVFPKYIGPCLEESCICPMNYDPRCASDGKTYTNGCHLSCINRRRRELGQPPLTVLYKGKCNEQSACSADYNPVCASDGNTYSNLCVFNNENLRRLREGLPLLLIDYFGECHGCFCPLYVDPVCGSDGVTYSNPCFLGCENRKREKQNLPPITQVDCQSTNTSSNNE